MNNLEKLLENTKEKEQRDIMIDRLLEANTNNEKMYPYYIFLTHSGTALANGIKKITKVPYSHASITFDLSLKNMYSFGRKNPNNPFIGTFVKENIRTGLYKNVESVAKYSVYVGFVPKDVLDKMEDRVNDFIEGVKNGKKFKYNFLGLFTNLLKIETERDGYYFCSEFVAEIIKSATDNEIVSKHRSMVKPYEFAKNSKLLFLTKGILKNYNEKKTAIKLKNITKKNNVILNETYFKEMYIMSNLEKLLESTKEEQRDSSLDYLNESNTIINEAFDGRRRRDAAESFTDEDREKMISTYTSIKNSSASILKKYPEIEEKFDLYDEKEAGLEAFKNGEAGCIKIGKISSSDVDLSKYINDLKFEKSVFKVYVPDNSNELSLYMIGKALNRNRK